MTVSKTKNSLYIRFDKYDFNKRIANPLIEYMKKCNFRYIELSKTWIIDNTLFNEEKVDKCLAISNKDTTIANDWTNPKSFGKKIIY
jgi:hypothetical protein